MRRFFLFFLFGLFSLYSLSGCEECEDCSNIYHEPFVNVKFLNKTKINALADQIKEKEEELKLLDEEDPVANAADIENIEKEISDLKDEKADFEKGWTKLDKIINLETGIEITKFDEEKEILRTFQFPLLMPNPDQLPIDSYTTKYLILLKDEAMGIDIEDELRVYYRVEREGADVVAKGINFVDIYTDRTPVNPENEDQATDQQTIIFSKATINPEEVCNYCYSHETTITLEY
ncbi:hypothetical protein [Xanthovirga aplysinae]|uniref:hypothetical protein n=1 Tax=Xanthovirga aplysinae TaxID=2529853 RepID=UPI0012BB619B|nr:hypothetical protein [Xanthovirga aplysinae]MTI32360.1 hypothetical protein [Xanthovirga aplysinae]